MSGWGGGGQGQVLMGVVPSRDGRQRLGREFPNIAQNSVKGSFAVGRSLVHRIVSVILLADGPDGAVEILGSSVSGVKAAFTMHQPNRTANTSQGSADQTGRHKPHTLHQPAQRPGSTVRQGQLKPEKTKV